MEAFDNNRFPEYEILSKKGDQTVNLFSLTITPMIWFMEYNNHKKQSVLDNGVNGNSNKTEPKEISFVEFGPDKSKKYFKNFEYVQCIDQNPINLENQSIFETISHYLSNYIGKTFSTGKWLMETAGSLFKAKQTIEHSAFVHPSDDVGDEKPFGSYTCNHGGLLGNQSFLTYIGEVFATPEESGSMGNAMLGVDDEVYEEYLTKCFSVKCLKGFEVCWNEFNTLFGFK